MNDLLDVVNNRLDVKTEKERVASANENNEWLKRLEQLAEKKPVTKIKKQRPGGGQSRKVVRVSTNQHNAVRRGV